MTIPPIYLYVNISSRPILRTCEAGDNIIVFEYQYKPTNYVKHRFVECMYDSFRAYKKNVYRKMPLSNVNIKNDEKNEKKVIWVGNDCFEETTLTNDEHAILSSFDFCLMHEFYDMSNGKTISPYLIEDQVISRCQHFGYRPVSHINAYCYYYHMIYPEYPACMRYESPKVNDATPELNTIEVSGSSYDGLDSIASLTLDDKEEWLRQVLDNKRCDDYVDDSSVSKEEEVRHRKPTPFVRWVDEYLRDIDIYIKDCDCEHDYLNSTKNTSHNEHVKFKFWRDVAHHTYSRVDIDRYLAKLTRLRYTKNGRLRMIFILRTMLAHIDDIYITNPRHYYNLNCITNKRYLLYPLKTQKEMTFEKKCISLSLKKVIHQLSYHSYYIRLKASMNRLKKNPLWKRARRYKVRYGRMNENVNRLFSRLKIRITKKIRRIDYRYLRDYISYRNGIFDRDVKMVDKWYEYIGEYRHLSDDQFSTMIVSRPYKTYLIRPKCVQFCKGETVIYETIMNMPDDLDVFLFPKYFDNPRKYRLISENIEKICRKLVGDYDSISIDHDEYHDDDQTNEVAYRVRIHPKCSGSDSSSQTEG